MGYYIPRYAASDGKDRIRRGASILVKIEDIYEHSSVKVTKVCDRCNKHIKNISYYSIIQRRKQNNSLEDKCKNCANQEKLIYLNGEKLKRKCVAITHPDFAKLFWNKNDTYVLTHQSNQRADFKCPECNKKLEQRIIQSTFKYGLSCPACSDGVSYPEKFILNLLKQLEIETKTQKIFSWSQGKRYDFYLPQHETIIEAHGEQHSIRSGFERMGGDTLEETQANDKLKYTLAINNGIHSDNYIEVDARYSTLEFMKESIASNIKLNKILDVSKVDYIECHKNALLSSVPIVCDLYANGLKIIDIATKLDIARSTVRKYLKKGSEAGLCNYSAQKGKKVVQLTLLNEFVAEYSSGREATKLTGVGGACISSCCTGTKKSAGGFKWMHKDDYQKITN